MQRAYWLAKQAGVKILYRPLPHSVHGFYAWRGKRRPPLIFLQDWLQQAPAYLHRSVLWHELGHYVTLQAGDCRGIWPVYTRYLFDARQEARARRWAAQHLITPREWELAAMHGCRNIDELACLWQVTREIAEIADWTHHQHQPALSCACPCCRAPGRGNCNSVYRRYE
ncbi:MAG: ImmA/IrrE family metallo-endopeptidase [Gaiellales bacterium]|nr:MAG: ImmA/IrrE family metallo-endopeptidase [Gaiellales bacterium]